MSWPAWAISHGSSFTPATGPKDELVRILEFVEEGLIPPEPAAQQILDHLEKEWGLKLP